MSRKLKFYNLSRQSRTTLRGRSLVTGLIRHLRQPHASCHSKELEVRLTVSILPDGRNLLDLLQVYGSLISSQSDLIKSKELEIEFLFEYWPADGGEWSESKMRIKPGEDNNTRLQTTCVINSYWETTDWSKYSWPHRPSWGWSNLDEDFLIKTNRTLC